MNSLGWREGMMTTTKPLNRVSYPIAEACDLLMVNPLQLEELLNAGVLNHAADGVQICAKSMDAYQESDGWIDWPGGECPVDGAVDVRFRCGHVDKHRSGFGLVWTHHEDEYDIVAYRVVPADQPADAASPPELPTGFAHLEPPQFRRPLKGELFFAVEGSVESMTCDDFVLSDAHNKLDGKRWIVRDQPAEPERQPQPGWYMVGGHGPYWYVGRDTEGGLSFQMNSDVEMDSYHRSVNLRHLPDCTGFDYVPPPEQTPAEKRLGELGVGPAFMGELGVGPASNEPTDYANRDGGYLIGADWTPDQLEAIAAHMREQEGGAA